MKIQRTPVIEIGKGEETTANKLSGEENLLERERDICSDTILVKTLILINLVKDTIEDLYTFDQV